MWFDLLLWFHYFYSSSSLQVNLSFLLETRSNPFVLNNHVILNDKFSFLRKFLALSQLAEMQWPPEQKQEW